MTHSFNPNILREYDIRGIVGDDLTNKDAYAIGKSMGAIAINKGLKPTATIGYDGRLSSVELSEHLIKGLNESGVDVINIGLCPTGMLYMAGKEHNSSIAIQITGSHNPKDYNGFKIMLDGKSFFGKDILLIDEYAKNNKWVDGNATAKVEDFIPFYANRILQDYNKDAQYNIVWDTGNGAMGAVIENVTSQLKGTHTIINHEVDGTFPNHHPDPTVESNLVQLKEKVAELGADMGIAFDGDGDRIGIIDGSGRVLWGDQMLCILARPVLKENPNAPILSDVKASDVLFDEIKRLGGKPIMVATGHSIVKTRMIEENSPLAGEMSAHIFFADKFYGHDDALYVAIRFINSVFEEGKTVAQLMDELPKVINTPEIRIDVNEEDKFPIIYALKQKVVAQGLDLCDIDGVRVRNENGWWLCRASNTQNALTMRFESNSNDNLQKSINYVNELLKDYNVRIEY
ncbi:MAG: phosphoglucomutase/phosphomannomutase PgmG [Alphaproteobacteria bacterium]